MELKDYLASLTTEEAKKSFAQRCGTSAGQLRQVAYGARRAGESLAINIERETGGVVTCEQLRPDVDWAYLRSTGRKRTPVKR